MTDRIIDRLSKEQLEAILDTLPLEFIFVDHKDCLQYYNKREKRSREGQGRDDMLGKNIRLCHQPSSQPRTEQLLNNFKEGKKNEDEFWIGGKESTLLNRFFAVRDQSGKYLGCLEYVLDFSAVEKLAEKKAGAYRCNPPPADSEKLEDEH
ncbi:MAG: PAS domain-containing protein [Deltaproteobacteria bacterium]|nr:PAS domain-containing protein [Deltaproteobacteria bacterium]